MDSQSHGLIRRVVGPEESPSLIFRQFAKDGQNGREFDLLDLMPEFPVITILILIAAIDVPRISGGQLPVVCFFGEPDVYLIAGAEAEFWQISVVILFATQIREHDPSPAFLSFRP